MIKCIVKFNYIEMLADGPENAPWFEILTGGLVPAEHESFIKTLTPSNESSTDYITLNVDTGENGVVNIKPGDLIVVSATGANTLIITVIVSPTEIVKRALIAGASAGGGE